MILEYRSLVKLKSTYIDALPKLINPYSGRIHTTYNQAVASTGRLSSTDPNLQNIPIRTELGKEIRRAFTAQNKGWKILAADYSQVELRIMAYISKDKNLIEAFRDGKDIHSATSSILYDIPIENVTPDMRRVAKTVNFGIMYGLGSFGLSQRLGIGRNESKEIIDNYFKKYPGIKSYIDDTINSSHKKGYAETLSGRRRYFPDLNSANQNIRKAAERGAINMPVQGTAADMMKIAMNTIHREMQSRGMRSLMMLQVHDELVFEACPDELDELRDLIIRKMESALSLGDVPVTVDAGVGDNWFEAH
jgi:DNA polymerase-1